MERGDHEMALCGDGIKRNAMTLYQVTVVRDALIADVGKGPSPLAVKFEPYLLDHMDLKQQVNDNDMAQIKADCAAFVMAAHTEAISRLREELKNDPTKVGYAGQRPEVIQDLLMTEFKIYADQVQPPTQEQQIMQAVAFFLDKPYALEPVVTQVVIAVRPPRIGTIWAGIPYCRNLPSLDNIAESLA